MKKISMILLLTVCAVVISANHSSEKKRGVTEKKQSQVPSKIEERIINTEHVAPVAFDSLEEQYEELEIKDLQATLEKVDNSGRKEELLKLSNVRKLTEEESRELTNLIRARIVLTKLVMERKFDELETL